MAVKPIEVDEHKLSNREKKKFPRKGKSWCYSCDAELINPSQKCPNCGNRERVRDKK